jgi:hypothetical protein
MPSSFLYAFEGWLYRAALTLLPDAFRREHGAEMARDFDEARQEAGGACASWLLRAGISIDLVRTLAVQWVRTGLPLIAVASILLSLSLAEALAAIARRTSVRMPDGLQHEDAVVVLFIAEISVVLIAMTILISLWVGRLMRQGRR